MNFLSLVGVELKKIRRSKILLILLIPVIMMWIPSIINADMNFDLRGIPITPENNFFHSGLYGYGLVYDPGVAGHLYGTAESNGTLQ